MKKLTAEGRIESGLDKIAAGRVWAFVATERLGRVWGLGVAFANEFGYFPIPLTLAHSHTYDVMQLHADELNKAEGLTLEFALRIVSSTMRGRVRA